MNKKIYKLLSSRNIKLTWLHNPAKDPKYCDYIEFVNEDGFDDSGYAINIIGRKQYELDVSNVMKSAIRMGKRKNGNE